MDDETPPSPLPGMAALLAPPPITDPVDTNAAADTADGVADAAPDLDCAPCAHATENGWWGPALAPARTHCQNCHRSWRSLREGHCRACCRHFTHPKAFDGHTTEHGCVDPADVTDTKGRPRFKLMDRGTGPVWGLVNRRPLPTFIAADESSES